jgi:23S rRNA (adenine2030-N6)-methyltransferase
LRGSGLLVVNPPFGFEEEASALLPWLWQALSSEREGTWRVEWLMPE